MKAQALHLCDQDQAVIFFSGWGMDAEPFAHWPLRHFSRDLWLVHSYHCPTDPTFLTTMKSYREIRIISWSFGVRCAWDWINTSAAELSVTSLTAINGTLTPIHRQEGIVPSIALKTLHGLTEQTYAQFLTNMCGSLAGTFVRPTGCGTLAPLRYGHQTQHLRDGSIAADTGRFDAQHPIFADGAA